MRASDNTHPTSTADASSPHVIVQGPNDVSTPPHTMTYNLVVPTVSSTIVDSPEDRDAPSHSMSQTKEVSDPKSVATMKGDSYSVT